MALVSAQDYEYRRTENSVSSSNYHFVFVPKRRKAVLVGDIAQKMQNIIFDLVSEHGWQLIALEVMLFARTYVHQCSHSRICCFEKLGGLKAELLDILGKNFPLLRSYLRCGALPRHVATTGQVSTDTIRKYIENQRGK